jgi:hypothetical protein
MIGPSNSPPSSGGSALGVFMRIEYSKKAPGGGEVCGNDEL